MKISDFDSYIDRSEVKVDSYRYLPERASMGGNLVDEDFHVALLGVSPTADAVRQQLYQLSSQFKRIRVADLGNVKGASSESGRAFALTEVLEQLLAQGVIPIVIADDQDVVTSLYESAKAKVERQRITIVDSMIALNETNEGNRSYLFQILNNERVEDVNLLGLQNYLCSSWQLDTLQKSDVYYKRMGEMMGRLSDAEPLMRDSDLFSFSFSAVRQSEAPAKSYAMPNGFNGFEACQLAQYAGLSDCILAYGVSGIDIAYDINNQTAALAAQVVWHIMTGIDNRFGNYPMQPLKEYDRFQVIPEVEGDEGMVFYHNKANGRWWVEIPMIQGKRVFACSKEDYKLACAHSLPDVWIRHYMR